MADSDLELEGSSRPNTPVGVRPTSSLMRMDPFVGNVSKYCPLTKKLERPTEKGQLIFDASFECGMVKFLGDQYIIICVTFCPFV